MATTGVLPKLGSCKGALDAPYVAGVAVLRAASERSMISVSGVYAIIGVVATTPLSSATLMSLLLLNVLCPALQAACGSVAASLLTSGSGALPQLSVAA